MPHVLSVCHRTVRMTVFYQLSKIKYDQDKFALFFRCTQHILTFLWPTKSMVSFLDKDKHAVNEHHIIQKSHDATQKKCPHMAHLIV